MAWFMASMAFCAVSDGGAILRSQELVAPTRQVIDDLVYSSTAKISKDCDNTTMLTDVRRKKNKDILTVKLNKCPMTID